MQYDLSAQGINGGQGWIMDSIAQEVDIESGEYILPFIAGIGWKSSNEGRVVFEWRAINHVDPSECYVSPGLVAGTGLTAAQAWQC